MTDQELVEQTVFPPMPASVPAARRFVAGVAQRWGVGEDLADAALVVSELVTNAVEHGAGPVEVVVRRDVHGLRIEVTTSATDDRPERRWPAATTPDGRGLMIVEALAAAWGEFGHRDRHTVWALLDLPVP